MKRNFRILLLFSIFALAALFLAACGHTHSFEEKWTSDSVYHWRAADCRHKDEVLDYSRHLPDGGKTVNGETVYTCKVCARELSTADFADEPMPVSLVYTHAPADVTVLVEGYFVGVADNAGADGKEILLKDVENDAVIGLKGLPASYGVWPNVGYKKGDKLRVYASVTEDFYNAEVENSQNKRYLRFSERNGDLESTVLSQGNTVAFGLGGAVLLESHEDIEALFKMESLSAYTLVRMKGRLYLNSYSTLYRPHMNKDATALVDIKPDGQRAIGLGVNAIEANIGNAWKEYFQEEWSSTSVASSAGYFVDADITALYTGSNTYNFHLTVLDASWLRPVENKPEIKTEQDAILEMANAYLRQRGQLEYDQFNGRRMVYATPEEATAQSYVFLDCSSYVTSVYYNTFGIKAIPDSYGSQNTKNYTAYAKANHANAAYPDIVGYWETLDYKTEAEQDALLEKIRTILQPGDILVYRRGSSSYGKDYKESNLSGHALLYMGDGMFSHSTGTSYNTGSSGSKLTYKDNPRNGKDKATKEEYFDGTVQWLSADTVINRGTEGRMLFGERNTIIYNFSIIRPLERKGIEKKLTEQAEKRMQMAGLSFELLTSAGMNSALCHGDSVTYTLTIKNHSDNVYKGLALRDVLPSGVRFVSGSQPFTVEGNALAASIDVGQRESVTVSWTLEIGEGIAAGTLLSNGATVNGLKMKRIENSVSAYTRAELALVSQKARKFAENDASFSDPMAFVSAVYTEALGFDPFVGKTSAEVLDALFSYTGEDKAALRSNGAFSQMVAPNLYGGSHLYSSAYTNNNSTVRTVYAHNLTEGDVILCAWGENVRVYIYLGQSAFVTIDSETPICKRVFNGSEQWNLREGSYWQSHLMASLFAYERYAILRPSKG